MTVLAYVLAAVLVFLVLPQFEKRRRSKRRGDVDLGPSGFDGPLRHHHHGADYAYDDGDSGGDGDSGDGGGGDGGGDD